MATSKVIKVCKIDEEDPDEDVSMIVLPEDIAPYVKAESCIQDSYKNYHIGIRYCDPTNPLNPKPPLFLYQGPELTSDYGVAKKITDGVVSYSIRVTFDLDNPKHMAYINFQNAVDEACMKILDQTDYKVLPRWKSGVENMGDDDVWKCPKDDRSGLTIYYPTVNKDKETPDRKKTPSMFFKFAYFDENNERDKKKVWLNTKLIIPAEEEGMPTTFLTKPGTKEAGYHDGWLLYSQMQITFLPTIRVDKILVKDKTYDLKVRLYSAIIKDAKEREKNEAESELISKYSKYGKTVHSATKDRVVNPVAFETKKVGDKRKDGDSPPPSKSSSADANEGLKGFISKKTKPTIPDFENME